MSLDPGQLRHRITFQTNAPVQDSNGDTVDDWSDYATVWAACEPVSVRDFIASRAEQSELTARFVIRHRADIVESMRIFHRGAIYNIAGVLPDKETGLEYLTLPCRSGVNGG